MTDLNPSNSAQARAVNGKCIRWRLVWITLLILLIGFLVNRIHNPELVYRGKTIDYWFNHLPRTTVTRSGNGWDFITANEFHFSDGRALTTDPENSKIAFSAFDEFGTNAIPFLFEKLEARDSKSEIILLSIFTKTGIDFKWCPFSYSLLGNGKAVTALSALSSTGKLPSSASQRLQLLTNSPYPEIRNNAAALLFWDGLSVVQPTP